MDESGIGNQRRSKMQKCQLVQAAEVLKPIVAQPRVVQIQVLKFRQLLQRLNSRIRNLHAPEIQLLEPDKSPVVVVLVEVDLEGNLDAGDAE